MGTVKTVAANEIIEMNTTFWAQGTTRAVYVLELGDVSVAAAVAALADFIDEDISLGNTYQKFFSYLVPREWDGETTFKTLTGLYTSPASLVYFFVTTTIATYPAGSPPKTNLCLQAWSRQTSLLASFPWRSRSSPLWQTTLARQTWCRQWRTDLVTGLQSTR
jgi:hypothetical protein